MKSRSLTPLDIPALLKQYGLRPDKQLGQNFLIDEDALQKVVKSAEITENSFVLEVGAGLGSLTRYLCLQAERVIAVELDTKLLAPLKHVLSSYQNVAIVQGDILLLDLNELIDRQSRMFGRTKKEIIIHRRFEKNLWPVEVDQSQMEQVLLKSYLLDLPLLPLKQHQAKTTLLHCCKQFH